MHFDLAAIPQSDAYKLLVSTVVPRPIALATTVDRDGRVIHIHIRDDPVDPERYYVATDKMRLVGRIHGRGGYARTSDLFLMERLSLAEWKDGKR
jgi:flavin reductase (DIM6/NTAB) family NADH-FMN oxidoreductase RutF